MADQRADMILLRANPLADISAVRDLEMVIAAGRVFDRGQLNVSEAKLREKATTVIELAD